MDTVPFHPAGCHHGPQADRQHPEVISAINLTPPRQQRHRGERWLGAASFRVSDIAVQEDVAWVQPGWEISPVDTLLPGSQQVFSWNCMGTAGRVSGGSGGGRCAGAG